MPASGRLSPRRPRAVAIGLLAALVAALAAAAGASPAQARTPASFFGVHLDGPATDGSVPLDRELRRIRSTGTSTVRVGVFWNEAQPYRTAAEVPPDQAGRFVDVGGVPTDFSRTDAIVAAAAQRGLRVLPVVQGSPPWAADGGPRTPNVPPADVRDYSRYLEALVRRYGSRGSFWRGRPATQRRTIRGWQVWNEPTLENFWTKQPFQRDYVRLLRSAHAAVRRADRGADVYLAGMTSGADVPAWTAVRRVYQAGGRRYFDVLAVHPYTRNPSGVITVLERTRREMRRAGDARKRVALTEMAWSSSGGDTTDRFATWDTTERIQARRVTQVMRALARRRTSQRIELVTWYSWLSPQASRAQWSRYAGLSRLSGGRTVRKPALRSYEKVVRDLRRG